MQNQCNLNVRSKCILNALRIRKGMFIVSAVNQASVAIHRPRPSLVFELVISTFLVSTTTDDIEGLLSLVSPKM